MESTQELREIFKENYERFLAEDTLLASLPHDLPHRIAINTSIPTNKLWTSLDKTNSHVFKNFLSEERLAACLSFRNLLFHSHLQQDNQLAQPSGLESNLEGDSDFSDISSSSSHENSEEDSEKEVDEEEELDEDLDSKNYLKEEEDEEVNRDPDWYMRGEVTNKERPLNSLVSEDLDFTRGKKVIRSTKALTADIESLLKQRIRDEVFDDVIRRRDSASDKITNVYHSQIQLDSAKSKQSLEKIYESELGGNVEDGGIFLSFFEN